MFVNTIYIVKTKLFSKKQVKSPGFVLKNRVRNKSDFLREELNLSNPAEWFLLLHITLGVITFGLNHKSTSETTCISLTALCYVYARLAKLR